MTPKPRIRDLPLPSKVAAVIALAVVAVVAGAVLVLLGRGGWHLFLYLWRLTG